MATFDILKAAEEHRLQADKLHWEGTFADYLEIVRKNPRVADLAHARVYDMIMASGVEEREGAGPTAPAVRDYKFFDQEIYGLDRTCRTWSRSTSRRPPGRLDIRKRILMLVGPVGRRKSRRS
jgi:serine protein kinase